MFSLDTRRRSAVVRIFSLARCVNVLVRYEVSIQQLGFIWNTYCVVREVGNVQFQRSEMSISFKIWVSSIFVIRQRQYTNLRLITASVRQSAAKTEHHRTKQCSFSQHIKFALFFFRLQGITFRSFANRHNCCMLFAANQPCSSPKYS